MIGHDNRLPDVRIGLATGSVIMQLGDVFGPPVNMAARLTGVARRNRVITDRRDRRRAAPGAVRLPPAAGPAAARLRDRRAGRRTPALRVPGPGGIPRSAPSRWSDYDSRLVIRTICRIPGRCPFCLFTLVP